MELWTLSFALLAAFAFYTKGHGIQVIDPITKESQHEEQARQMASRSHGHTDLQLDEAFDVEKWTASVLMESYSHLSDVDIFMVKPKEMSEVTDHLMRDLIFMHSGLSEEQADCIVLVYSYGGIRYLYKEHLTNQIHQEVVQAFNHVTLHIPLSQVTLASVQANQNISQLIDLVFHPLNEAILLLDSKHGQMEESTYLFKTIDQMLQETEIRHQSVHNVVIKLVSAMFEWLQRIDLSHSFFDLPCPERMEKARDTFQHVISGMHHNLQQDILKDLILTAFGEESAAIVESFADKLVVMKSVMKVLELLKAVQFEEVSMSIVNNEFVPEHVKLHRGRKTVLGFVVDTFLGFSRHDYYIDRIMEGLEHSNITHFPFTTPALTLQPGDFLPIVQELFHLIFEILPQNCLDIKMLAALPGMGAVSRQSFSLSNPHILSVLHKTWDVVKLYRADHHNYTFKTDFWLKAAEVVDTYYLEALKSFTEGMESVTGGELITQTLAADTLVLVHDDLPLTIRELFHEIAEIHVMSLLEEVHCVHQGTEAYGLALEELKKFAHNSHMEASVVETHLCNSIPICGDKALATEMSTVMAEAFNSAIPSIQGYVLSLISLWYVPDEPVTYYRTAFTDFIGATASKFLYLQYNMLSEFVVIPRDEDDSKAKINRNLLSLMVWQHQLIQHLYDNYMSKVTDMHGSDFMFP